MVVLGGLGSISGSISGAVLLTAISAALADYPEWRMVIYSIVLIVLMLNRPRDLWQQGTEPEDVPIYQTGRWVSWRTAQSE